jgi:hypothetical protein
MLHRYSEVILAARVFIHEMKVCLHGEVQGFIPESKFSTLDKYYNLLI